MGVLFALRGFLAFAYVRRLQPVGVGFSWSGNSADYSMGDWDAARDNFAAIQVFLERFPAVATNDFYITAESYGGHYMPTLAKYIMDHQPNSINFKGFAVGNPFTSKVSAASFFYPRDTDRITASMGKRRLSGPRSSTFVIEKNCYLLCHSLLIICLQQHILASCCCGSRAGLEPNWRVQHHFWPPAHFEPSLPFLAR